MHASTVAGEREQRGSPLARAHVVQHSCQVAALASKVALIRNNLQGDPHLSLLSGAWCSWKTQ